ncbi:MAG: YqgE/AlgH family protein [Cyclobacteriaceae bacterium]|nr:YqgE/AlgH family protein [Cyclobacteriaceae bacterium]MCH8517688.1 YqgE/AlgH family protein [Cyclobacteriaceae bacterium]
MSQNIFDVDPSAFSDPQKGNLLISEPFLPDPNFGRTVILLCEHNDEGSFGFVLNKPSLLKVSDVVDTLESVNQLIKVGGPVEPDTLHMIHRLPKIPDSLEVIPGLYWGGNFETIQLLANTGTLNENEILFFTGYSGWGRNQLQLELEEKTWYIKRDVKHQDIFDHEVEMLWKNSLQQMGGRFKTISQFPEDPRLN